MPQFRRIDDPTALNASKAGPREKSPRIAELEREYQLYREQIGSLTAPEDLIEIVILEREKPATVRQRVLRVAGQMGVSVAVRKYGDNLALGLLTPERETKRGRPKRTAA